MSHKDYIGPDGKIWPSVTQIAALLPQEWKWGWYKSEVKKAGWNGWLKCEKASEDGMKLGTQIHAELESMILDNNQDVSNEAQAMFDKTNPLIEEYIAVEKHLVNDCWNYAGTADMIVRQEHETGLWIGDWKTGATKSLTHPLQLAAYAEAWNSNAPDQVINQGFIVRLNKKTLKVYIDEYKNLDLYFKIFLSLRNIYYYLHKEGAYEKC